MYGHFPVKLTPIVTLGNEYAQLLLQPEVKYCNGLKP